MEYLPLICLISVGIIIILKILFWYSMKKRKITKLLKSFTHLYTEQEMYDIKNRNVLRFYKASNILNFLIFLLVIILIAYSIGVLFTKPKI